MDANYMYVTLVNKLVPCAWLLCDALNFGKYDYDYAASFSDRQMCIEGSLL